MKVRDPVCGMTIEREKAAGTLTRQGQTYYFCFEACRKQFEAEAARYVKG